MRVSKMTVYRLVHSGELPAVRVGRSFRVPEDDVNEYLRKQLLPRRLRFDAHGLDSTRRTRVPIRLSASCRGVGSARHARPLGRACRTYSTELERSSVGSVIKKRRKRMAKKKHRKLLKKTRVQRRVSASSQAPDSHGTGRAGHRGLPRPRPALRAPARRRPAVERVIGVDVVPPRGDLGDVSFVRADIRNPVIAKVIAEEDVDTVVHMSVIADPRLRGRPRLDEGAQRHRHDAAARRLPAGARSRAAGGEVDARRSTARRPATRRCSPRTWAAKRLPRSGFAKDVLEVEGYVRGSPAAAPTSP